MKARLVIEAGTSKILETFDLMAAGLVNEDKILRGAVANLYVLISERIQQRGLATDGSPIGGGRYSASGARYRAKHGRQTDFIDLTFTGDMLDRGLTYGPFPLGGFGLGFTNQLSYDRMRLQEQRYNQAIISPNEQELAAAAVDINNAIRDQIRSPRS